MTYLCPGGLSGRRSWAGSTSTVLAIASGAAVPTLKQASPDPYARPLRLNVPYIPFSEGTPGFTGGER